MGDFFNTNLPNTPVRYIISIDTINKIVRIKGKTRSVFDDVGFVTEEGNYSYSGYSSLDKKSGTNIDVDDIKSLGTF